jgi:hypothetical protein
LFESWLFAGHGKTPGETPRMRIERLTSRIMAIAYGVQGESGSTLDDNERLGNLFGFLEASTHPDVAAIRDGALKKEPVGWVR